MHPTLTLLAAALLLASCSRGEPGRPAGLESAPVPLGKPSWEKLDDARSDGWDSEVFAAQAGAQMNALGKLIVRADDARPSDVEALAANDFACGDLRPARRKVAFQDGVLEVEREDGSAEPVENDSSRTHRGRDGLAGALNALAQPFRNARDARFELKVIGVWKNADSIVTRQLFAVSGSTDTAALEQHATWTARWTPGEGGAAPKLRRLEAAAFEQTRRASPSPLFADCTESVLGRNAAYADQFLHGLNYWLERIQDNRFFSLLGAPGLAVGDVNGDGLDDLYVCQEGGLPNRLFVQNSDGTATDASEASGANWIDSSRSALLVDLDNDGNQDLAVASLGNLVVASGDGKGHFAVKSVLQTSHDTMSLSAADFDADGDLDIYLCSYKQDDLSQDSGVLSIGASGDFVYHDANNGAKNYLFRNDIARDSARDAAWRFTDATVETGLDVNNRRFSFAAAWEDFDNDGDQDLYVANDFGRNALYRNEAAPGIPAKFTDVAAGTGAEDSASGMGVTWGDFDRDGWMDLYVSNMFSSAGSRITYQPQFKADATEEVKTRLQRFARGNTLLKNAGGRAFSDVSESANATVARWAWSSNFLDIDNDGWEDLVVANGYVTTEDPGDL